MIKTNLYQQLSRFEPHHEVLTELRKHYLSLPNKTVEGWDAVYADTEKLYFIWRHYLNKVCGEDVKINSWPPPIHLRTRIKDGWIV
jgi:hypothetical protein